MNNISLKYLYLKYFVIFFIVTITFILISCSLITDTGNDNENEFSGQIVSDLICAVLKPDGTVWTWGNNSFGTLGIGKSGYRYAPVQVLHIKDVTAIDTKAGIAAAADKKDNIWFWGYNINYGYPDNENLIVREPVKISSLRNVISMLVYLKFIYFASSQLQFI